MTVLNRNPQNTNPLQATKFLLTFARLPSTQYFCQEVNLPGVTLGTVDRVTPFLDMYSPGTKLKYDDLNISFIVDEELQAWKEIHDWIRAMTFPTDFKEYSNLELLNKQAGLRSAVGLQPQYSDATITLLSNANNPTHKFTFYEVFPTTLSTFVMSASDTPDTTITADVTFRYSYYNIDKMN